MTKRLDIHLTILIENVHIRKQHTRIRTQNSDVTEPANPPATGPVTIETFTLAPDRIPAGECTTLSWEITNADVVTLSRDGTVIYNAKAVDSYQDCFDQAGVFRYRLDASNSDGQFFNWSELQVIVQ